MSRNALSEGNRQRGATLVVVLLLLLIVTLLGVATLRGTIMEERMSANLYDRSLSFQAAESALRDAEAALRNGGMGLGQDCTGDTICSMPDPRTGAVTGCPNCWVNVVSGSVKAAGQPQYLIQRMAETTSVTQLGLNKSAQCAQTGGCASTSIQGNYRVFARSHDPGKDVGRSVVVLHANIAVTSN